MSNESAFPCQEHLLACANLGYQPSVFPEPITGFASEPDEYYDFQVGAPCMSLVVKEEGRQLTIFLSRRGILLQWKNEQGEIFEERAFGFNQQTNLSFEDMHNSVIVLSGEDSHVLTCDEAGDLYPIQYLPASRGISAN